VHRGAMAAVSNKVKFKISLGAVDTLLTLLRILFLGRIGSISYVLPIRQNINITDRNFVVEFDI
jgi:hypothetical protein